MKEFKKLDGKYIANTYARSNIEIVSGSGSRCFDSTGKEYVDFTSGIGVNSLGFANSGWANAIASQLNTMQHISNLYHNNVQIEVAQRLCELTNMQKVFFANSGAEANECAFKIARKYAHLKKSKRKCIVTLLNSFHGRTITLLKANGQKVFHKIFTPLTPQIKNLPFDRSIFNMIGEKVGAVFVEVIQGEGGVIELERELLLELEQYCKEKDILFMVDEVQTGIGRTGEILASQAIGLKPDIITLAKGLGGGLPVGVCLLGERVKDVFEAGDHGSTFGGNPAVLAGVKYVLNTISNRDFLTSIKEKSKYLRDLLSKIDNIKNISGTGLMIGFDVEGKQGKEVRQLCESSGLLVLTAKDRVRLLPALNISYEDIDFGISILKKCIEV